MSDSEFWKEEKAAQKLRRAERLPGRQTEISALSDFGYQVRKITDWQFRVNEAIDLYPTHRRYHVLASGKRGGYQSAAAVVKRFLVLQ